MALVYDDSDGYPRYKLPFAFVPTSGFTISSAVLSGLHAHFVSGICADISGNLADFSGITIDIVSGLRGSFSSGLVSPALSGLLNIQMSGAVSGRVLTSDTSGNVSWQPAPAGSVPDPIDNSGAMIDILSGVRATFNSGVEAPSISGNLARFSGITSEILSGNQLNLGSGLVVVTVSAVTADLSGLVVDIVSGLRGLFGSGLVTIALSGLLGFQMSGALSGRVVTSDNAGVGTWQIPPAGGGVKSALIAASDQAVWTNMPGAGITEIFGTATQRAKVDLTGMTDFFLVVNTTVAGASVAALIGVQYSTDDGTNWNALDTGTASAFNNSGFVSIGATGTRYSGSYIPLATGAKAFNLIRFVGKSGNATADPNIACNLYVR